MSIFNKILHGVGLVAGGLVVAATTGGIALPAWLIAVCGGLALLASGVAASPFTK